MASTVFKPEPATTSRSSRRALPKARPAALPPRPHPVTVDLAAAAVGIGFGASVGLALAAETAAELHAPGGALNFLGSLTGLSGTYLALVMVLLVSRFPAVERVLGHDGLLRWHKRLAPWPIWLIAAHAGLLTLGYAEAARVGPFHELGALVGSYPSMLAATIALGLMLGVAAVSTRAVRGRLKRETWWTLHLFMYLALVLAFPHEIALGPSFVGHPLTQAVWSAAWAATAGVLIAYRLALPLLRTLRHRLVVEEVHPEAEGVVSVVLRGRHLERLRVAGGQFFEWRFLVRGMWWQAHPFSLSARPRPPHLRLTIKAVGDFSSAAARLRPGTRVALEGPYGAFTVHSRRRRKVALIAGGIGVTAVRALLEDLPRGSDPVVVLRTSREEDLALAGEVAALVKSRKGRLHELVGSREAVPVSRIARIVPDISQRDVYVSGPEGFVRAVRSFLQDLGLPKEAVHYEAYAL